MVNLVGIATEHRKQRFDAVHTLGAERVAKVAAAGGARHLVHVSAMGADQASPSVYARTKAAGEKRVREAFPSSTILRPSVVFGFGDEFFNRFAILARFKPGPPLIGGGNGPRMQPVYAGDVADAVVAVLARVDARGKVYELGGPKVYSFKELMEFVLMILINQVVLKWIPVVFVLVVSQTMWLMLSLIVMGSALDYLELIIVVYVIQMKRMIVFRIVMEIGAMKVM